MKRHSNKNLVKPSLDMYMAVPAWLGLVGWQAVQLCAEIVEPDHGAVWALLLGMLSPTDKHKYVR
jgi:hypothetical protein